MAYSFSGRVRYSEIGENGLLTLPGILNYFQDCSTFHSEAAGLGVKVLKEKNKFWVLFCMAGDCKPLSVSGRRNRYFNMALWNSGDLWDSVILPWIQQKG